MKGILLKVQETIRQHELMEPGGRILVAVSGGPDSVALLHILLDLRPGWGWEIAAAHLHHGLRGGEADADLAFTAQMVEGLGIPFFHRVLPPGGLMEAGGSLQEAARVARYAFLEETLHEWGGQRIAVGHQADDQAETVVSALLRGAGTRGLRGMPYRRGAVVRPILDITRQEILDYLAERSIPFRQDPSNEEMSYKRNWIRHELIPSMSRFNQGVAGLLRQTARICMDEDDLLQAQAEKVWNETILLREGVVEIPAERYRQEHRAIRRRILVKAYEVVRGDAKGLAFRHVEAMDRLALDRGRERWLHLPGGVRLVVGGGRVVLGPAEAMRPRSLLHRVVFPGETRVPEAGLRIRWDVVDGRTGRTAPVRGESVHMDLDAIQGGLLLRGPRAGDRLRPVGLGGTKKVHDILVDSKVPRRLRWRVPLLVDDAGVVWVVGHELDQRVRPHRETRRILVGAVIHEDEAETG